MGEIEFGLPKEVTKPSSIEALAPFDWEGGDNQEEATWLEVGTARHVIFKAVEGKNKAKDYEITSGKKQFELDLDAQRFSQLNSNFGDIERAWAEIGIPTTRFGEWEYEVRVIWEDDDTYSERQFNFKISDCNVVKVNRPLGEKGNKHEKELTATKGDLRWLEAVFKNCATEEKQKSEELSKAM